MIMENILKAYAGFKENIPERFFPPEAVEKIILENNYTHEIVGRSFENRPVYRLSIGEGKVKILLWAQMHGNETTASRAVFDLWKFLHQKDELSARILNNLQIDFIPQLNPDGAEVYTRRNAAGIDINRDFLAETSPEIKILKNLVHREKYDFLFNMHDQRTIFHPRGKKKPATLSFLAPSVNDSDEMTENRLKAAQLIAFIQEKLGDHIPDQTARFSHEFYPSATGDNFQKAGYPTVLIECGHYPLDYQRNETRKFTFITLLIALTAISNKEYQQKDISDYEKIPLNGNKAFDILYKGVKVKNEFSESIVDIGIMLEEVLDKDSKKINFIAKIAEVGDLSDYFGHDIYHAENRVFKNKSGQIPEIGKPADFELGECKINNGIVQ